MTEAFAAGGWGMFPTLLAGVGLLVTSLMYARQPETRYVPLMVTLGLFTLFAGGLGFFSGLIALLRNYTGPLADQGPSVLFVGLQEALHNVVLALLLITVSALSASVGALRLARQQSTVVPVTTR
jgi:ABC-type phosphate/phosphonate transport system permease subunit